MGGALALRFAERLRLSRTFSVAGGWTMAWSTSRPPQAHARPSTPNTRQRRSPRGASGPASGLLRQPRPLLGVGGRHGKDLVAEPVPRREHAVVGHAVLPCGRDQGREALGQFDLAEEKVGGPVRLYGAPKRSVGAISIEV